MNKKRALVVAAIFIMGLGIGAANGHETIRTVEQQVPGATVTKEVALPDCLRAIDLADETFREFTQALEALRAGDPNAARFLDQSLPDQYNAAKGACREAAAPS